MRNKLISGLAAAAFSLAASEFAFAADMAVKAPLVAPAPVLSWTGFYAGIQFGGGWSDESVGYSANDPISALFLSGTGAQPGVPGLRIRQDGAVGGIEAGYNWQVGSNWLLGIEADFSLAGMNGRATASSPFGATIQAITGEQSTDWYGTVRGRLGWLATPNFLLFGTGGFAYGRVAGNANLAFNLPGVVGFIFSTPPGAFSLLCALNAPCFTGSAGETRSGWTAGGGAEYLFDQHWSGKIEYQFVNLGTETVRLTGAGVAVPGTIPSSFNVAFRDQFHVVRVGLNYRFW